MSDVSFTIVNVVSSTVLGRSIEFSKVAPVLEGVIYPQGNFHGQVYKLKNPKTTLLIFESGKIVCMGAKSVEDSIKAIDIVLDKMRTVDRTIPWEFEVGIRNIVVSADLGKSLDLERIALDLENTEYEPEQFPGLVYRLDNPKITFLLFNSGKLICTGAKTIDDLNIGVLKVKERLCELNLI
jgi:transcription initiation factor TFIID TATA-box-binding protein